MTSRDFCYWAQGFFEIANPQEGLTPQQTELIKKHLNMVFFHEIDPSYSKDPKHLAALQKIHDGLNKPVMEDITDQVHQSFQPSNSGSFLPHSGHTGNYFPSENDVILRC